MQHIDGLTQDCSNPSALAMELLQSCAKLSIYWSWELGLARAFDTDSSILKELICIIYSNLAQTFISFYSIISSQIKR